MKRGKSSITHRGFETGYLVLERDGGPLNPSAPAADQPPRIADQVPRIPTQHSAIWLNSTLCSDQWTAGFRRGFLTHAATQHGVKCATRLVVPAWGQSGIWQLLTMAMAGLVWLHRFPAALPLAHSLIGFAGRIRSATIGLLSCTTPSTFLLGMRAGIAIICTRSSRIKIISSQRSP